MIITIQLLLLLLFSHSSVPVPFGPTQGATRQDGDGDLRMALALPSASPFLVCSTANLPSDSASPSWDLRSGQVRSAGSGSPLRRMDGMGWDGMEEEWIDHGFVCGTVQYS